MQLKQVFSVKEKVKKDTKYEKEKEKKKKKKVLKVIIFRQIVTGYKLNLFFIQNTLD